MSMDRCLLGTPSKKKNCYIEGGGDSYKVRGPQYQGHLPPNFGMGPLFWGHQAMGPQYQGYPPPNLWDGSLILGAPTPKTRGTNHKKQRKNFFAKKCFLDTIYQIKKIYFFKFLDTIQVKQISSLKVLLPHESLFLLCILSH